MKAVMAGLVVVVAVSATAAGSASAASWYVGGTELASSAPLASTTALTEPITFNYLGVVTECSGIELKKADIAAHTGGEVEHFVFTGCVLKASGCSLEKGIIESKPLKVEAALGSKSPEDTVLLKPVKGEDFARFIINGTCIIAGESELQGKIKLVLPKGREEATQQEFRVNTAEKELLWNDTSVHLIVGAKAKLESAKGWSFH